MSTHRILLIENDATEARLARHTLLKIDASLEVIHLHDGADFLEYYCDSHPLEAISLAIMDLHMPQLSGLEVLEKLQREEDHPPFPIILFSSSQDPREIRRAYDLGGSAFVTKPDSLSDYREAVRNIINFWISTNRLR